MTSVQSQKKLATVNFKCVGVTRDPLYQETLKLAFDMLINEKKNVPVRLNPEPNNPYDSHAVAFECEIIAGCWKVFGYVPKELCDFVLSAIDKGDILNVEFSWIKYKIIRSTTLALSVCALQLLSDLLPFPVLLRLALFIALFISEVIWG